MWAWPELDLSDYERKYVRYYKTGKFPGVLRRVYEAEIVSQAIEDSGFPQAQFTDYVQVARRMRVFALTFVGDIGSWYLDIQTATGEKFTAQPCLVSSMASLSRYDASADTGEPPVSNTGHQMMRGAMVIEPNWELLPNQTLTFTGSLDPAVDPDDTRVLFIGVHVWEFPGMAGRVGS